MTQQYDSPKRRSKFPQYIAPIIILLLAIGGAIYGVLWSQSNDSTDAGSEETSQAEQPSPSESSAHLDDVEQEFPDAEPSQQEALAVARSEMETYIHSEKSLVIQLTDPQDGTGVDEASANFALENIATDWNQEAHQFATAIMQEYPDLETDELENIMQHDPQGPQFSEEQTQYALSQLNS